MPFELATNPQPVRAKFHVVSLTLRGWATEVQLSPVSKGDDEDKAFWAATPSGNITMTIKNEKAAEQFAPGQEWYVDFIPAGDGAPK